jgi:hypothetical protein
VGVGLSGRVDDLRLRRARLTVGDVLADGAAEQQHVLRHNRRLVAQVMQRVFPGITAVDQDAPARRVVEAQQQRNDCRFAGAARSHERDALPGVDGHVHVVQYLHVGPRRIRERHMLEGDLAAQPVFHDAVRQRNRQMGFHVFRSLVEQFADPMRRAEGALNAAVYLRE